MRAAAPLAALLAFALAAPASAHLLVRGIPLSELAATSPVAVAGTVQSAGEWTLTLKVEQVVLGALEPAPMQIALEGHHPPRYEAGSQVLVFLTGRAAPWTSRQTALDLVELPGRAEVREALFAAVRSNAALRAVEERDERIAGLKELALANLGSPSERVRREALFDLVAIANGVRFAPEEVARVRSLAASKELPSTLAPGLVVLLATLRSPEADSALVALVQQAANPQVRARAARVVGHRRHHPKAVPALRAALKDPELAVRLTARRALDRIDSTEGES